MSRSKLPRSPLRPAYGAVRVPPKIGTAKSRTDHVICFVEHIYTEERRKITGNTRELDQLDAWRTEILQKLNGLGGENISDVIDNTNVPVTSSEAKEIIASIRSAFDPSTKDLAAALGVERQTVYAWIRGENEPSMENSRRLRAICSLAEEWKTLSKLSAKHALRVPLGKDEVTLSDLLTREILDEAAIRNHLPIAAKFINERYTYRPSIDEFLREKGLDPARYRITEAEFNAATGASHFSEEAFE